MELFSPFYAGIVIAYIVLMVGIGLYMSKTRVNNDEDFIVAGKSLPFLVLMGTMLATWCGSGNVIGQANFIYQHGPWAGILWGIGEPIGMLAVFFLAAKIRSMSDYTIPQIMEKRYGRLARILTGLCIIMAYVGIASYQFKGGGVRSQPDPWGSRGNRNHHHRSSCGDTYHLGRHVFRGLHGRS